MEISSNSNLLNNGLSTYHSGQRQMDQASGAIASNNITTVTPQNSQTQADRQDLTDSLVQLKVGEVTAQTGARVIQTADQVLGTLIDTRA